MMDHPMDQRRVKTNVAACIFTHAPLVLEDFLALRQELPVKKSRDRFIRPFRGRIGS